MNLKSMSMPAWIPGVIAIILPVAIPIGHILVLWWFWSNYARTVNRESCTCDCWDTVFKGPYESGVARYKHFYFNATDNVVKIWVLSMIVIIVFYECIKRLIRLMFAKTARYSMIFLFCLSIFPNYYAWWMYVNYYNDDFYSQWYHQTFFTITELISTGVIFYLANADNSITARKVFCIVGISILHIIAGGLDQFFSNVFNGEGALHQIIRDIGFMIPDICQSIVPCWFLYKQRQAEAIKPFYQDCKFIRDAIAAVVVFAILLLVWSLL